MRVHLGSDHAGFELKRHLEGWLRANAFEPVDHGAHHYDPEDDYPGFCFAAAEAVVAEPGSLGVVLGGSGNGEQIAANKVRGVRAALVYDTQTARLAREHNDATVMSLGARSVEPDVAVELLDAFLRTPFSGQARHVRRIAALDAYESGTG